MISVEYLKIIKIIYIGENHKLVSVLNQAVAKVIVLNSKEAFVHTTKELNSGIFQVDAILLDTVKWKQNNIIVLDNFKKLTAQIPIIALAEKNDLIRLRDAYKINISAYVPLPINIKMLLSSIQRVTLLKLKEDRKKIQDEELALKGRFINDLTFGMLFDADDNVIKVNEYASKALEYRESELIGNKFLNSIFQNFSKHKEMKEAMLRDKKWHGQIEIFSQKMKTIILEAIYTPEFANKKLHQYSLSGFIITQYVEETSNARNIIKATILSNKKKENALHRRIRELEQLSEERYQKNIDIGNNDLMLSLEKARNKIAEQTTQLYIYEEKIQALVDQVSKLQKQQ